MNDQQIEQFANILEDVIGFACLDGLIAPHRQAECSRSESCTK